MRKNILFSLLTISIFSAMIMSGCKKDDSSPTSSTTTPTIPNDLTNEQALAEAQNGAQIDPRGTYYVNSPFLTFITQNSAVELQYKSQTSNGGSGTFKMEGSSATEGTWSTTNVSINVDLVLTITMNASSSDQVVKPTADDLKGFNGNNTGTWKTIGDKMIITVNGQADADTSDYGVTSKGLFLANLIDNDTQIYSIKILKK